MKVRALREDEVTFTLNIEDEDRTPRYHFLEECGWAEDELNFPDAEEFVAGLERRLEQGDLWAFCSVRVEAHWGPFIATTYLGCCSYRDEDEFKSDSTFQDMKNEVLHELNLQLEDMAVILSEMGCGMSDLELVVDTDDLPSDVRRLNSSGDVCCPDCFARGPHDDNGCRGEHLSFACRECGMHFDWINAWVPRARK